MRIKNAVLLLSHSLGEGEQSMYSSERFKMSNKNNAHFRNILKNVDKNFLLNFSLIFISDTARNGSFV